MSSTPRCGTVRSACGMTGRSCGISVCIRRSCATPLAGQPTGREICVVDKCTLTDMDGRSVFPVVCVMADEFSYVCVHVSAESPEFRHKLPGACLLDALGLMKKFDEGSSGNVAHTWKYLQNNVC